MFGAGDHRTGVSKGAGQIISLCDLYGMALYHCLLATRINIRTSFGKKKVFSDGVEMWMIKGQR